MVYWPSNCPLSFDSTKKHNKHSTVEGVIWPWICWYVMKCACICKIIAFIQTLSHLRPSAHVPPDVPMVGSTHTRSSTRRPPGS